MKLEYFYDNNNNVKYTLKTFSILGLAVILISSILGFSKGIAYYDVFGLTFAFIILVVFLWVICLIIITLENNYKRKEFTHIKNNGNYFVGVISSAFHSESYKGYSSRYSILWHNSGEIWVTANNQTYKITDIAYNKEFKFLKQKLDDNFYINKQKYINLYQNFKNNGIFDKVQSKEITVGIYVLDNKVVADLDSIKIN